MNIINNDMINKDLIVHTTCILGCHLVLFYKASAFHWNVEGPSFVSLHKLFKDIYEDMNENVDMLGEKIRYIKGYPPNHLMDLLAASKITTQRGAPSATEMVVELEQDMTTLHTCLVNAFAEAEKVNDQALMNYFAERMDAAMKWAWQLRAFNKA
jgi:starvation-inducible DNA-binding protein